MKQSFLSLCLLCMSAISFGGWTTYNTTFEGRQRSYKIYKPASPLPDAKVVVLLHGLGATMNDFDYTSWPAIADSANVILISPQGLPFSSLIGEIPGVFNSGMVLQTPFGQMPVNGDVNDVGFVSALLDTVMAHNSVNANHIYATGFSNGGFMTQRLATELTGRLAAVASVSGTRSVALPAPAAGISIPVAHFHGDADTVVYWNGYVNAGFIGADLGISADSVVELWRHQNNTTTGPDSLILGNSAAPNYITQYRYKSATGASVVELFKIHNGTHSWYNYNTTANGFDIAHESWKFFNRFYTPGSAAVNDLSSTTPLYSVYPNPATDQLSVTGDLSGLRRVSVFSVTGKCVLPTAAIDGAVDISQLPQGVYFIKLEHKGGLAAVLRFVKH